MRQDRKPHHNLGALVLGLALLLCLAAPASAELARGFYSYEISATDANTTTTFIYQTRSLTIENAGANEVFVQINGAATTASTKIPAGRGPINLGDFAADSVGVICSTGETSTVYIDVTTAH